MIKCNKTNLNKLNPLNLSDLHHKLYMRGVIKFEQPTPPEWINLFNNHLEFITDEKRINEWYGDKNAYKYFKTLLIEK